MIEVKYNMSGGDLPDDMYTQGQGGAIPKDKCERIKQIMTWHGNF